MDERKSPAALVLTKSDIADLMMPADYLRAVEQGFMALAQGRAEAPSPLHIVVPQGGFHAKGAGLVLPDGRRRVAVKINGNFPGNPVRNGLPTIQGAIVLSDGDNGAVLALMDSIEVTLRRTAAATALVVERLAEPEADRLAVVGCGAQALPQIEAVAAVRGLREVVAFDLDAQASARLSDIASRKFGCRFRIAGSLREAVNDAPLIVTCTTAKAAFLDIAMVAPGSLIAAVGADAPHKHEIAPTLMAKAFVVVDQLDQCLAMGDLRHAVAAGAMTPAQIKGDLAGLVAGTLLEKPKADDIVVFDSTGLAVQDVATAAAIHDRALNAGRGRGVLLSG